MNFFYTYIHIHTHTHIHTIQYKQNTDMLQMYVCVCIFGLMHTSYIQPVLHSCTYKHAGFLMRAAAGAPKYWIYICHSGEKISGITRWSVSVVSNAKSSAADRVISAALLLSPERLLSPPARLHAMGKSSVGMAASDREITGCSPEPPANHIIWLMSQPEREGLSGGEAGSGAAAAGGLVGVAGGLADKEGPLSGGSDYSGPGESSSRYS